MARIRIIEIFASRIQASSRALDLWVRVMIVLGAAIFMVAAQAGPPAPTAPDGKSAAIVPPNAELATGRARTLDKTDVDAWLDGFMPYALHRGDIAGAVVVVVKNGQPLTARGFGYADVENRKPVEPARTLFRPGSISKLMTWTAVMQLVEQGKLDLDADVNRYLDFRIPPYQGKPLTLHNLMHHTTGFDDSARKLIQFGEITPEPLGQVLREALPKRILPPGGITAYSNYGVGLAGYIVERASRMPFEDYVERHIFAPLDMDRSTFRYPLPAQLRPDMSKGYALGSGAALPYEVVQLTPAGSMATTGADIGKFMIGYLSRSGALIRPASAALMYDTTNDILPRGNRMALGFFAEDRNGHRVRSHAGDTILFHSHVWLFIDDDVGVFLSLNSAGRGDAAAAIRTMFLKEFADRYFPGDIAASYREPLPEQARSDARLMAGQYWTSWRSDTSFLRIYSLFDQITVTATDGGIGLTPDRSLGGGPRQWIEIAPLLWRASDTGNLLEARVVDGRVERFATLPYANYVPVPWFLSARWLIPAGQLTLLIIAVSTAHWSLRSAIRRWQGRKTDASVDRGWFHHATRTTAVAVLLVMASWCYVIGVGLADLSVLNGGMDVQLTVLQVTTAIATFGLVVLAALDLAFGWTAKGWGGRFGSLLLLVSAGVILYISVAFHLIRVSLHY